MSTLAPDDDGSVDREMDALHRRLPGTSQSHVAWRRESATARRRSGGPDGLGPAASAAKRVSRVPSASSLPLSHIQAHLPFYTLCQQPLDPMARNWNAEFQDRWSRHRQRESHYVERREQLKEFVNEYEAYCHELVRAFVDDPECRLSCLTEDGCMRVGNLVLQVWHNVKLAQNMQRCFCAAMECQPPNLSFPLTATFRYLNIAVSVQALIPLRIGKVPEYRGDGLPDLVVNVPLCEYLSVLQCATNVKPTTSGGRADKIVGIEVYEALDAALYVFNCIGLLPGMRVVAAAAAPAAASAAVPDGTEAVPLRRWRHMVRHEARTWSEQPSLDAYTMSGSSVCAMLSPLLQEPAKHRLDRLTELLHENGLNICLLGSLAQWLMQTPKDEQEADLDTLLRAVAVEVLARTIRGVLSTQTTRDGLPVTVRTANTYLMRAMASVVDNPAKRFRDGLQRRVEEKFLFDPTLPLDPVMDYLEATLQDFPSSVTQRLCQLSAIVVVRGSVARVECKPSKHNPSSLYTGQWEAARTEMAQDSTLIGAASPEFNQAYLRPLQEEQYYRLGRLDAAWDCVNQQLEYWRSEPRARFMTAHLCSNAALCAAMCGRLNAAEYLARTAIETLQHAMMYASDTAALSGAGAAGPTANAAAAAAGAVGSSGAGAGPSRYGVFVYGLARARLTQGYVRCYAKDYFEAGESFDAALRTPEILGPWRLPYIAQLRLEAILGLFEVTVHASAEYIECFARIWEATCETLPPTLLGAHVHELLGSLYMERQLYQLAAVQFWDCVEMREAIVGEDSPKVALTFNKLGLLYYNWDTTRYGLYCSCILHRAEAIMASVHGLYSAQHVAVSENIIALFIRRGQYVEASQRLYTLQHLPPRYAKRLPRDHPTIIRLSELETKLRISFTPWAAQIIQRSWRQYRARLLVRKVLEDSARLLQRAGRGLMVRKTLALMGTGRATIQDIFVMEMMTNVLTASDDLVRMSARFSRQARDWNVEYQSCRLLGEWNTGTAVTSTVKQLDALRAEFSARATELARQREQRVASKQSRDAAERVGGGGSSSGATFVKDNILMKPVPKNDKLTMLQNLVYEHFSRTPLTIITAPLSTIVSLEHYDYFAVALPPLHGDPEYFLCSDGRRGHVVSPIANTLFTELVSGYYEAGLTSMTEDHLQGVECVRAQDNLYYLTNGLGLVNNLLTSDDAGQPSAVTAAAAAGQGTGPIAFIDPGVTASLQERSDWVSAPGLPRRVLNFIAAGKSEEAMAALEAYAMSSVIRTRRERVFYSFLIEVVRSEKMNDLTSLEMSGQRATSAMEECGAFFFATILGLVAARVLCARDAFKAALPFLLRNVVVMRRKLRLHAYFSSFLMLDNTMLLLTAASAIKKPVDTVTLEMIIPTLELGEPSCALFAVLERMIYYCHLNGRNNLAEDLQALRTARAKQLSDPLRRHLVASLMKCSDECAERSAPQECVPYLTASIHLCSLGGAHNTPSIELGVLYTEHGAVLTVLSDLVAARKSLSKAWNILSKTSAANSPEMLTLLKHHRILKARLRDNAILIIRRAVRRWREQRHLDAIMARDRPEEFAKLQSVRVLRRMNRLLVSEATSRVLVLEAQTEAWYQLLRKQLRLRNEAMLRQTYGTRVQIYVDKLASAREDIVELALATKATIADYGLRMQQHLLATALETTYRLERRVIIRDWTAACVQLKMWHVEHVDVAIRHEFLRAYQRYLLRCVAAEEGIWRRMIAQNQLKTKQMLGRYIVKKLRQRPRNPSGDHRAIEFEETRLREKICAEEAHAFKEIGDVFIFGPEVLLDDDDDW